MLDRLGRELDELRSHAGLLQEVAVLRLQFLSIWFRRVSRLMAANEPGWRVVRLRCAKAGHIWGASTHHTLPRVFSLSPAGYQRRRCPEEADALCQELD